MTLRSIGDAVITVDGDWRVCFMNPVAERLTGWLAADASGRELADVLRVSISGSPRPLPGDGRLAAGGVAEGTLRTADGREVPVEESSTTIRNEAGRVVGSVIVLRDISARPAAGRAEPSEAGAGLHDVSLRALQRLVLGLEDRAVEDIVEATALVGRLVPQLTEASARRHARRAEGLLGRALDEIRAGLGACRSAASGRQPLRTLLTQLAARHEALSGQVVEITAASDLGDCALVTKVALCRILQEALASEGGSATSMGCRRVSLVRAEGWITLSISDAGAASAPFEDEDAELARRVARLRGIHERTATLGGTVVLSRVPGRGFELTVSLPAE